jgi:hypothetical protein
MVAVAVYNLSGKLLQKATIRNGIVSMKKGGATLNAVHVVTVDRMR